MRNVYLDYSATTPVKEEVLKEMIPYFTEKFGNPSSLYDKGLESKDAIIEAKEAFETLTYDQQQLVENADDLKKAIEEYNKLVVEYNKDIEDEEQHLDLIEELHVKNRVEGFIEDIKDDKAMTAVTVLVGTVFGGFLIYGLYKLISKFARWVRR